MNQITNTFEYSTKDITELLNTLKTDGQKGLNEKEAEERLKIFGLNDLEIKEISGWDIFLRQFKSAFIYLLLGAIVITIVLEEFIDSLMILIFLIIDVGLGFYQEYSSEKTAQLLKKYTSPKAKVLRNGEIKKINANYLVPGDIVGLEAGDKVPADIRLIEQNNFVVDESLLTGESAPVFKKAEKLDVTPDSIEKAQNLVFSGSLILKGEAKGIVITTGQSTFFGKIAKLTSESRRISDFEKGISHFSKFIIKLVGITLAVVFVAHLLINKGKVNIFDIIVFSVALAVSVIPEALPLVTTFSLSRGARRLAKKDVIVKRLSAVEDLGSIEVLCSDKTGTLTKNKLKIADIYSTNKEETIWLANLSSSFVKQKIEPFEVALEDALTEKQKREILKIKKITEIPFEPETRRDASLIQDESGYLVIEKGAPEVIISLCSNIDEKTKKDINYWTTKEGMLGRRTLAVAFQRIEFIDKDTTILSLEKKKNFSFAGAISFIDPLKESSIAAIQDAQKLGIRVIIITGDSPEVAGAVAYEVGLVNSPYEVVTGEKWRSAEKADKEKYLEEYSVFARMAPDDKYEIIQILRQKYAVGFLGEGINDAPALKIAGVSIVVDSATDVAREVADIILLKNDLKTIIDGIKEGRKVFANTTKYIKATLASNFGNFFAIATASLATDFLPMLPAQILLVNLLSDTPMISISTDNVDKADLRSPKKYEVKEIIVLSTILGVISTVFDFIFFGLFYRLSPTILQTNWFIGSILTELVFVFSIRTKLFFIKGGKPSKTLVWLSILAFILTVSLPFTSFGQKVFKFSAPELTHLILIFSLVIIYFAVSELIKLMLYRKNLI